MMYEKVGPARFISHLDLLRTFGRAARRAGLPLAFTQGFNPHPKITFAAPLAVGISGEAERKKICVDVELLSSELGVPVVATAARSGRCLDKLMDAIDDVASGRIKTSPRLVAYDSENNRGSNGC
jgi:hypothetical protein